MLYFMLKDKLLGTLELRHWIFRDLFNGPTAISTMKKVYEFVDLDN